MTIYTKINHWTGTWEFCINRISPIKHSERWWSWWYYMVVKLWNRDLELGFCAAFFTPCDDSTGLNYQSPDSWWQFCMGHMFFVFFNSLTTMPMGGFYGTFNPSCPIRAAACSKETWAKILILTEGRSDPESNQIIDFNRFSFKDHHCNDREHNCKA
jgi:hypothetical protein